MRCSGVIASLAVLAWGSVLLAADAPPDSDHEFTCRYAAGAIKIDGTPDEEAWKAAQVIDYFYQPWLKAKARRGTTITKARLLWDLDNLYLSCVMQDNDLYADIKEHDGEIWNNDVFELFFKPHEDKPGYYEFQVSPAGTLLDMFLPRRGAGGYRRFAKEGKFHLETKVVCHGTLNKWRDKDEGWTVEGRIPWVDFSEAGGRPKAEDRWRFALCRYDYSIETDGPELTTCAPLSAQDQPDFHHFEEYATLRFAPRGEAPGEEPVRDPKQKVIKRFTKDWPTVTSKVAGSPDPPPPYRARRVMPELKLTWPIFVAFQPGSDRLLVIDQKTSYGEARLCRTTETPGELEALYEFPNKGVGYTLAFHPKFATNGYLYVGWNGEREEGKKFTTITRFEVAREPPYTFDKESAKTIIEWASNGHNGAAIAFGKDGMLYVTSGDGTSDSDTDLTGQGLDHLLAKLLRIDVDHPDKDCPYSIPKDNPFVGQKNARPETYAYGFRNPWRITVDDKTGDVWVGQNGQDLWEQAYLITKGANYGWSVFEGSHPFYPDRKRGPTPISKPTVEHSHSEARSLTGGLVYYGQRFPELRGAYIYGDYSTGKIWGAKVEKGKLLWNKELADTTLQITSFAVDKAGELLISDHHGNQEGGLFTLEANPKPAQPQAFPRKLSETGLFTAVAGHRPHPGLIPYSVNAPLWSDGAYKERYLYLPPKMGPPENQVPTTIALEDKPTGWNLPDGTVAVKSFALETQAGEPASRRWIETRLLTRQEGEWVGYCYMWNDEQTEATLVESAGLDRRYELARKNGPALVQTWHFPSRTECMVCHSRAANYVLGLSSAQMNKTYDHAGVPINQLDLLTGLGILKGADKPPQEYASLVDPYDAARPAEDRVRAYLHANCAQCHVEAGGGNAQMELSLITAPDKMRVLDVPPLHDKLGLPEARLVAPGKPDSSVLLKRMAMRGRGQMPPLASSVVDQQAVELIRDWIKGLKKE